jgi:hypothetical protein
MHDFSTGSSYFSFYHRYEGGPDLDRTEDALQVGSGLPPSRTHFAIIEEREHKIKSSPEIPIPGREELSTHHEYGPSTEMKIRSATLQGIAAGTLLVLFLLGATAHAVSSTSPHTDSATTVSTSTTASAEETHSENDTQSQVGANETSTANEATTAENQTGDNETPGPNNQVGENQTEGDNVNVVQIDQDEQNEINNAEGNDTIVGEVQVKSTGALATTTDSRFTLTPSQQSNGGLSITITGLNVMGPKSFLVDLSSAQDPTTHTLVVTLDGARVSQVSALKQVLHPSSNTPAYIVVKSASGYQLLVSILHFSTHVLSIVPLAPGPVQGFYSISGIEVVGAAAAITAAFALAFATRKRIYATGV